MLALVDHIVPERSSTVRPPTDKELRATLLLELPITEASAKVRTGGPIEEPEDLSLPIWAGELPLRVVADPPIPDGHVLAGLDPPPHVLAYRRGDPATA